MDGGGFKVPVSALGRRKQVSEKSQSIGDHAEQRKSKLVQNPDEARPEIGEGINDVPQSVSGAALYASSDRDGQNSDKSSLDGGSVEAELPNRVKDEIKDGYDPRPLPVDGDTAAREGAPSSEGVNKSSDDGREGSDDKQSHDLKSLHQPAKSASKGGGEGGSVPRLPYTVPHWSGEPPQDEAFSLSVIKNGTIVDELALSGKAYLVFGRLPTCDVQLEHPSISRYHAVLQYRPASREKVEGEEREGEGESRSVFSTNPRDPGYYVYDLGSTHGTYLNKSRLDQRCYYRVRVGQMVKFGGSSRLFLLEVSTCTSACG